MNQSKVKAPETTYFKGGEKAVLIFHAYTGSPNDVRMLGRYLNNNGYTVLMPMFAGHGTMNPEDILNAGPDKWLEDRNKSIQFLQNEGCKEIAVFGLSLGGLYAASAIADFPDTVIGGGPFCSPLVPDSKTNITPQFLKYGKQVLELADASLKEIEEKMIVIETKLKNQLDEISRYTTSVYNSLPTITQPVMLVQAGRDKMINPQDVYIVQNQFQQAVSEVYWYAESGHVITVGPERQQLQQDVLTFLQNLNWNKEKE